MMRRNLLLVSFCAVISVALGIRVHPNDKGRGRTLQRAGLRQRSGVRHRRLQSERADRARPGSRALSYLTTSTQFEQGISVNILNTDDKLQLSPVTETFPFIWIPTEHGTILKFNTTDGTVLGVYRSAPEGRPNYPTRIAVDLNGNVWAGNGKEDDGGKGSVVHIGLKEYGQCIDRNGDGVIDTSTGLGDLKDWTNANEADTDGGVSTAKDECILDYVRTAGTEVRTIAVDANNDVWVGGLNEIHEKIDGTTGQPDASTKFTSLCGDKYSGLVDSHGVLWSAGESRLLRYDTNTTTATCINVGTLSYGLGLDTDGNIWNTNRGSDTVKKISPAGTVLGTFTTGEKPYGVAVTPRDNHVWIANSYDDTVTRLDNSGAWNATIQVGDYPVGLSVDSAGKVWVVNYDLNRNSENAMRIDPETNAFDLTTDVGLGFSHTNSDMTGAALLIAHPEGTWTVIQDSGGAGTAWGVITWNTELGGSEPTGTSITVEARAHDIEASLNSVAYIEVSNRVTPPSSLVGQYLQVKVTLRPDGDGNSPVLSDIFANRHPVAQCANVTAEAVAPDCNAAASIDAASYDPDVEKPPYPRIVEDPSGPYELGDTLVTLNITDEAGEWDECQATVTVVDAEAMDPANINCGHDGIIRPCNASDATPFSIIPFYQVGHSDHFLKVNGCPVSLPNGGAVHHDFCKACNGAGKKKDRDCRVLTMSEGLDILDTGGVADHISFTVTFVDSNDDEVTDACTLCVETPKGGCHEDRRQLKDNKPFSCGVWTAKDVFTCN